MDEVRDDDPDMRLPRHRLFLCLAFGARMIGMQRQPRKRAC
jgi:hypothetical protein